VSVEQHPVVRYAVRTQRIVTGGLAPTMAADTDAVFRAVNVNQAPGDPAPGAGPRDTMPRLVLMWHDSLLAPAVDWRAGDRLDLDGHGIVELLEAPVATQLHAGVTRWQANAMPVAVLRPLAANVITQSGAAQGAVTIAVWRASTTERARGETIDYQGEAGVEHAALLTPENRRLAVGGAVLRVTGATVESSPPRVMLELRAPDG
jgi:hypothetical protein